MSYDLENASLFARFLRVKAVGGGAEFAQTQWGPQSRVAAMLTKSALSTLDLGSDADLRAASSGFLTLVRSRSLIGKIAAVSGFARLPFDTPVLTQKTPLAASWAGESGLIPVTTTTFERTKLDQKKIASIVPVTNELLKGAGANFESSLNRDLVAAVAELEGKSFISVTNSGSADSPPSVTAGVAPVMGSADPKADIQKLLDTFTGDIENAVLVTRPDAGVKLYNAGYLGAGAKGGDVAGMSQVASGTVDVGTVVLIDPSRILLADDGVTLDMSDQTTVVDENGNQVSLWQRHLSAIRAVRYLNWEALPGSVSVLSAPWA